jgi:hypothetical protein
MGHASPKFTLDVYARLFDRQGRAEQAKARMEAAHGDLLGGVLAADALHGLVRLIGSPSVEIADR